MKQLLMLFQLFILVLCLKCDVHIIRGRSESAQLRDSVDWKCEKMDTALIMFEVFNTSQPVKLTVNYQYEICNECDLIVFSTINYDPLTSTAFNKTIDSYYSYWFEVRNDLGNIVCDRFVFRKFGECGVYKLWIDVGAGECRFEKLLNPQNSDFYLILGVGLVLIFFAVSIVVEKYHMQMKDLFKRNLNKVFSKDDSQNQADTKLEPIGDNFDKNASGNKENQTKKPAKTRLQALDTFRGLSLFLMIFINYGSGGYKFLMHVPWHGISIADFVFPWFLWIMGFSIPLATHSLLNKPNARRLIIFRRIVVRSIKMFLIGIMLNSRFGVKLENLRIFGVLQRIAICYFLVATLELVLYKKVDNLEAQYANAKKNIRYYTYDLIWSWAHFVVMILVLFVWFMLTYLVQIEGCPRGYMGPGGLDHHGKYYNCTGGLAGWLDRTVLGRSHVFQYPTPLEVYKTIEPFDPEGFMGIFMSVILTYMGVHAGRIYSLYKTQRLHQVIKWTAWGVFSLVLYFALTQFDTQNGSVPVNKNLWTFTFTLVTGASSYFIFVALYCVIDIAQVWSGCPLIYLGMNSIVIYFCHSVFSSILPVYFIVPPFHVSRLLMNLWGCVFWTLIAIYMYLKKIFINL